jgi:hypothetical protein
MKISKNLLQFQQVIIITLSGLIRIEKGAFGGGGGGGII